jgi:hypothetical protein
MGPRLVRFFFLRHKTYLLRSFPITKGERFMTGILASKQDILFSAGALGDDVWMICENFIEVEHPMDQAAW